MMHIEPEQPTGMDDHHKLLLHNQQSEPDACVGNRRRCVMYARVSTKEQEKEGFSIPAQRKLLQEYAQGTGFTIVKEFTDVETAKQAGRIDTARRPSNQTLRRHL
jgi:predicted site-specific integrase-resolvase